MTTAKYLLLRIIHSGVIFLLLGFFCLPVFSNAQIRKAASQPQAISAQRDSESYRLKRTPVQVQLPVPLTKTTTVAHKQPTVRGGGLVTLMQEDFEGDFPSGSWAVTPGDYAWAKRNCTAHSGGYSAWAVGGGTVGSTLACGANYPNSVFPQMTYGPFDLRDANWAFLDFYLNLNAESDYDFLQFTASIDGVHFYGYQESGTSNGDWLHYSLSLNAVPVNDTLANFTGQPTVWIAFFFVSDNMVNYPNGAFIDDVVIQKGMVNEPTVVSAFTAPDASPRGLAFDGVNLWCSGATNDQIYKLNSDGSVLFSFASPGQIPTGLAWDGSKLWNADYNDEKIYSLSTAGSVLSSFTSPGIGPAGLTWDGSKLWVSDVGVDTLWQMDPGGWVTGTITAPGLYHYGLAWDGSNLWLVDADALLIYRLDTHGNVLDYYLTPGTFPSGLVWDGNNLWLSDRDTDLIYQLGVQVQQYTKDVGATAILLPTVVSVGDAVPVSVVIKNFGTASQGNFPVSYRIGSNTAVTQTYSGSLAAGSKDTLNFTTNWQPAAAEAVTATAWTALVGDERIANDTLPAPKTVTVKSNVNSPPTLSGVGDQMVIAGQIRNISLTATDVDEDPLSFNIPTNPGFLSITGFSQTGTTATATLVIAPAANITGSFDAQVQVSDSRGGIDSESLTIEVSAPTPTGNWTRLNPKFLLGTLAPVQFVDANNGWLVASSRIQHTTNGGNTWQEQTTGSPTTLYGGQFLNTTTGWVVGGNYVSSVGARGKIFKTINSGDAWIEQLADIPGYMRSVCFVNADTGWVVGGGWMEATQTYVATILHTNNGGMNWTTQPSPVAGALWSVFFINNLTGWAVGENGTILKTVDAGQTWVLKNGNTSKNLNVVFFADNLHGWIGAYGDLLKTDDGGENWTSQNTETNANIYSLQFLTPQLGWAVGDIWPASSIYKTTNGGSTWSKFATSNVIKSIWMLDEQHGWAAGESGLLMKTENGSTWTNESWFTLGTIWASYFLNANTGWLGTAAGTIISTSNGGADWTISATPGNDGINDLYFADSKNGWACQNDGYFLRTRDGGNSWTQKNLGTNRDFYGMYFLNGKTGWAVGGGNAIEGFVYKTTDGGDTWVLKGKPANDALMDVYFIDANIGWIVGMSGLIFKTINGGDTWTPQTQDAGNVWFNGVYFQNANIGFVVGDGVILKTTNGGTNWTQVAVADGVVEEIFFVDQIHGWAVGTGAGVAKGIGGNDPGIFLLSYGSAKIWQTDDGGDTWIENDYSGNWLLNLFFTDLNSGWAVGNKGGIFKYTNTLPLPAAPDNMIATALSQTEIQVSWADNSTNETGFQLYRSDSYSGAFHLIASLAAGSSSYTDNGLTNGTTYWYKVLTYNATGKSSFSLDAFATAGATAVEEKSELPRQFALAQNFPNPFNPETVIQYQLPKASAVKLEIYNISGARVRTLVDDRQLAGYYTLSWNGRDDYGIPVASGIYFCNLRTQEFAQQRKLVLIR